VRHWLLASCPRCGALATLVCSRIIKRDTRCVGLSLIDEVWLKWLIVAIIILQSHSPYYIHCYSCRQEALYRPVYYQSYPEYHAYKRSLCSFHRTILSTLVIRSLIRKVRPKEMAWQVWRTWSMGECSEIAQLPIREETRAK
jgi:hypothetical protein